MNEKMSLFSVEKIIFILVSALMFLIRKYQPKTEALKVSVNYLPVVIVSFRKVNVKYLPLISSLLNVDLVLL